MKGPALYLKWLGLLCGFMALFCFGVFIIGYKDPSFGRVATTVLLVVCCPAFLIASKKLANR
jgi:hypothetical protein